MKRDSFKCQLPNLRKGKCQLSKMAFGHTIIVGSFQPQPVRFVIRLRQLNICFFTCPVARVVWRTVGSVFETDCCPNSLCTLGATLFPLARKSSILWVWLQYVEPYERRITKQSLRKRSSNPLLRLSLLLVRFCFIGQVCRSRSKLKS